MKPLLLLSAVLFAAPLVRADALLSVLPPEPNDTCAVGPYAMYTGEGSLCGFRDAIETSYTQSGDIVTVTSGVQAGDPWMDGIGTWTFDLSHLYISGDSAEAFAWGDATSLGTDPHWDSPTYGEYVTYPVHATLYVAGVPLDPPASVPEPASFALAAAPLLLLAMRLRKRGARVEA
jgi:hypothetical protein